MARHPRRADGGRARRAVAYGAAHPQGGLPRPRARRLREPLPAPHRPRGGRDEVADHLPLREQGGPRQHPRGLALARRRHRAHGGGRGPGRRPSRPGPRAQRRAPPSRRQPGLYRTYFELLPHVLRDTDARARLTRTYRSYRRVGELCLAPVVGDVSEALPLATVLLAIGEGIAVQTLLAGDDALLEPAFAVLERRVLQRFGLEPVAMPPGFRMARGRRVAHGPRGPGRRAGARGGPRVAGRAGAAERGRARGH